MMAGRFSFFSEMVAGLLERTPFRSQAATEAGLPALCQALVSGRGEVSGKRIAAEILSRYREIGPEERLAFFHSMAKDMDVEPASIIKAAQAYAEAPSGRSYQALATAAEPPRQEFLRRLNQAPGATFELVKMRLELLKLLPDHPELGPLDVDFTHLFRSWFNRGFLVLRRIDWHTPANILEKIIQYEAVHAINDWSDLQRRVLPADRRCFAFFHPAMLEEPLIFVEVALTPGVPDSVQQLLAEARAPISEAEADTAVFYSISNCQEGLRGISFGNSLIKQVVEELHHELPGITTFVTLSPIPGLMKHLSASEDPAAAAIIAASREGASALAPHSADLRRLAADYLLNARNARGEPADPVARFHLGNGAQVHKIHAGADTSPNGLRQSAGAMVNYLYDPARIETNHEAFVSDQVIAASKEVRALSQTAPAAGKTK